MIGDDIPDENTKKNSIILLKKLKKNSWKDRVVCLRQVFIYSYMYMYICIHE
jgi:hypothetical protein